jgi:hypothetical protein
MNYSSAATPEDQPVYTIDEFCRAHRLSRRSLYDLWKNRTGPLYFKAGSRTLIRREAAAAWRAERERAAQAEREAPQAA